jgi:hypothetical protein
MTVRKFWQRISSATSSGDLDDFRRDMVLSIDVMLLVGWLILWAALHYRQPGYFWAAWGVLDYAQFTCGEPLMASS